MFFLAAVPVLATALASRQWALAYHFGVFGIMVLLYTTIPGGFKANFTDGKNEVSQATDALYFAGVTHTTVG